jgi:FKBP-type peptidyl-prolyl cis-trans isomerase FkpA
MLAKIRHYYSALFVFIFLLVYHTDDDAKADTLTRTPAVTAVGACADRQLKKELKSVDEYLAAEKIIAQADPSGLRYVIHQEGEGLKPKTRSIVTVDYVLSFLSPRNVVISQGNTTDRINLFIRAWQVALPMFTPGTRATLYIPSCLAYGEAGIPGKVPPYSTLVCEIELRAVKK